MNTNHHTEPPSGDYAALVEGVNGGPPGKVQEKAKQSRPPGFDVMPWFVALVQAAVLGGLSYVALSQRVISLPGRYGERLYDGSAAVWLGFALLAAAMLALTRPIRRLRVFVAFGMLLLVIWMIAVAMYLAT